MMKNSRNVLLKQALFILAIGFACVQTLYAQNSDPDKDKIRSMIDAKRFTFQAQTAIPQRGSTVFLTSEYDLKVARDTVTAFLPYYGQAFSAPMDPSKGGIKFTSTDFTYITEKKKRGWNITITPKDVRNADVRYMVLNISDDGYGSLRVFSNNRDGITFSGNITDRRNR